MRNILKLSRKFVVLAVMLFALGVLTFSDSSGAAPCCSDCESIYQDCIDGGGTPSQCFQQSNSCWRWCDFDC